MKCVSLHSQILNSQIILDLDTVLLQDFETKNKSVNFTLCELQLLVSSVKPG